VTEHGANSSSWVEGGQWDGMSRTMLLECATKHV